jgi:hypothetical protein
MRILTSLALMVVAALAAQAEDRPVTEAERERLVTALAAEGCSGGALKWDDDEQEFQVGDATCSDGRRYDLEFDAQFRLKMKEPD